MKFQIRDQVERSLIKELKIEIQFGLNLDLHKCFRFLKRTVNLLLTDIKNSEVESVSNTTYNLEVKLPSIANMSSELAILPINFLKNGV